MRHTWPIVKNAIGKDQLRKQARFTTLVLLLHLYRFSSLPSRRLENTSCIFYCFSKNAFDAPHCVHVLHELLPKSHSNSNQMSVVDRG